MGARFGANYPYILRVPLYRPNIHTGKLYGAIDLSRSLARPLFQFVPVSREQFRTETGIDPANLYDMRDVGASPIRDLGYEARDIVINGSPQFRYQNDAGTFIRSSTAGQYASGSGGYAVTSSVIYGAAFLISSASSAATNFAFGQSGPSQRPMLQMRILNDTTKPGFYCSDTGSFSAILTPDISFSDAQRRLALIQVDRAGGSFNVRISGHGQVVTASVSAATCGPISALSASFLYILGVPGLLFSTDVAVEFLFTASGSSCDGRNKLEQVARGLGYE